MTCEVRMSGHAGLVIGFGILLIKCHMTQV